MQLTSPLTNCKNLNSINANIQKTVVTMPMMVTVLSSIMYCEPKADKVQYKITQITTLPSPQIKRCLLERRRNIVELPLARLLQQMKVIICNGNDMQKAYNAEPYKPIVT